MFAVRKFISHQILAVSRQDWARYPHPLKKFLDSPLDLGFYKGTVVVGKHQFLRVMRGSIDRETDTCSLGHLLERTHAR